MAAHGGHHPYTRGSLAHSQRYGRCLHGHRHGEGGWGWASGYAAPP